MRTCTPMAFLLLLLLARVGDAADEAQTIRIGYQRYGTLNILKIHGNLDRRLSALGVTVSWLLFPAGPQLLEGMNVGSIDVGSTGEAPPIFAQAAGVPLVYLANEPANPGSEAIIVPKDSPITSVAQLVGKRLALNKGSNVHYLLLKVLEHAGVSYDQVAVQFLKPADARSAFEREAVDAWAIWDPFLTAAVVATSARTLADGSGLVANREFYLAHAVWAAGHKDLAAIVLEELQAADDWAVAKPREVAEALAPDVGVAAPVLERIVRRQSRGVERITPAVLADQQRIADAFHALGLLPTAIQVTATTQH